MGTHWERPEREPTHIVIARRTAGPHAHTHTHRGSCRFLRLSKTLDFSWNLNDVKESNKILKDSPLEVKSWESDCLQLPAFSHHLCTLWQLEPMQSKMTFFPGNRFQTGKPKMPNADEDTVSLFAKHLLWYQLFEVNWKTKRASSLPVILKKNQLHHLKHKSDSRFKRNCLQKPIL